MAEDSGQEMPARAGAHFGASVRRPCGRCAACTGGDPWGCPHAAPVADRAEPAADPPPALRIILELGPAGTLNIIAPTGMPLDIVRGYLERAATHYAQTLQAARVLEFLDARAREQKELARLEGSLKL